MKDDGTNREAVKATWFGFFLNLLLTIFKFITGFIGNSSAMIADSVHSFSDIATDIAVLFGLKAASQPRDDTHAFGHGKIETLVTTFIGFFLLVVAGGIIYNSARDIISFVNGETLPVPGWIAAAAALVSIVSKEAFYHYSIRVAERSGSTSLKANAWHHRTDSLTSAAVLFGIGAAILLGGRWAVLDPVAAGAVSLIIIYVSLKLIRGAVMELSEASLDSKTEKRILDLIRSVDGARTPHNLRTRRIGPYIAIDVHVKAPGEMPLKDAHDIATHVEDVLEREFGKGTYIHVHMDPCDV